jgi:hypothetical protein
MAANAGVQRNLQALARGRAAAHGFTDKAGAGWAIDIEGACAELAVAKAVGTYWEPVWERTDRQRDDVEGWQIRSTPRANGCLIVHPSDPDDARFVLVTGTVPTFTIVGWLYGWEAKSDEFWRDPGTGRPAYFVPAARLRALPSTTPGYNPTEPCQGRT